MVGHCETQRHAASVCWQVKRYGGSSTWTPFWRSKSKYPVACTTETEALEYIVTTFFEIGKEVIVKIATSI